MIRLNTILVLLFSSLIYSSYNTTELEVGFEKCLTWKKRSKKNPLSQVTYILFRIL